LSCNRTGASTIERHFAGLKTLNGESVLIEACPPVDLSLRNGKSSVNASELMRNVLPSLTGIRILPLALEQQAGVLCDGG
jgi:hypothetical protein